MIIERLGEGTPTLEEALNTLGATIEDGQLIVRMLTNTAPVVLERMGKDAPLLEEVLTMLNARVVIPTHAIRHTPHGIEVNVQHHYARLHEGEWKLPRIEQTPKVGLGG